MAESKTDHPGKAAEFIKMDWATARYVDNQHVDNLISVVLNLGTELWAVRRRQMALESLLEKQNIVPAKLLEAYEPSEAERIAWGKERDDTIERIYSALHRVGEPTHGIPTKTDKVPPLGA